MNALDLLDKTETGYNVKTDRGIIALFVGRSGSGKTAAAASFPGKSYYFDVDNRIRGVLAARKWLGDKKLEELEFDQYSPSNAFGPIDDKLSEILAAGKKGTCPFQNVFIDSVGSLLYTFNLESLRLRGKDTGKGNKVRGQVQFLTPDDYNYASTAFRMLIFNGIMPIAACGINVIFSGWVIDKWGKSAGNPYGDSEVVGEKLVATDKIGEEIPGYFDEMYYFRKAPPMIKGQPPLYTVEFTGSFAKTVLGLPPGQFDITNKSFYDVWKAEINKKEKPSG